VQYMDHEVQSYAHVVHKVTRCWHILMTPQLNIGKNPNEKQLLVPIHECDTTLNSKISNFNKTTFIMSNTKQNKNFTTLHMCIKRQRDQWIKMHWFLWSVRAFWLLMCKMIRFNLYRTNMNSIRYIQSTPL